MCLIAIHTAAQRLSDSDVKAAYAHNRDGIGIMYAHRNKVWIAKSKPESADQCLSHYTHWLDAAPKGVEIVAHWRYATHGTKSLDNVHPFSVPGSNAALAHNGVISGYGNAVKSDTLDFVETRLAGARKGDLALTATETVGSRLALLWSDGEIERTGTWIPHDSGALLSNSYSLAPRRTPAYTYFDEIDVWSIIAGAEKAWESGADIQETIDRMVYLSEEPEETETALEAAAYRFLRDNTGGT